MVFKYLKTFRLECSPIQGEKKKLKLNRIDSLDEKKENLSRKCG